MKKQWKIGSFVHPECRPMLADGLGKPQSLTASNAIASTFGMTGKEYAEYMMQQT